MNALFSHSYARLMRLHQPVGIWLLLWPCLWSLALAGGGRPPLHLMLLFALGAVVMRGAGCVVNDLTDRTFDAKVERTQTRPLASGEISVKQAVGLLAVLLTIAFLIALAMGGRVVAWAAASLPLIAAYPWMKRITWWPQAFLGLTFNWGALLGWVAITGNVELPALLLYLGGLFWTLGYDTIYAHQDIKDDALIGVKSTALLFKEHSRLWIGGFYTACILCLTLAGISRHMPLIGYGFILLAAFHLLWQITTVAFSDKNSCRKRFVSNSWTGLLIFLAYL